jgi:hypothetical protein
MRLHQSFVVALSLVLLGSLGVLHAQPPAFKPIEINAELNQNDAKDEKLQNPCKVYPVKLQKDKTYLIDLVSQDFDAYLRLLDKKGNQLAEDDDAGGNLNARIIHSIDADGDYQIVATSFDGAVGKFSLKVRELTLKGEAKPRAVGKDGITLTEQINQNSVSDLGKLGKLYSVQLQAGKMYTIDLESATMDSYLYLFDGKSKLLAQDDDSGGDLNSRIVFRAERDGVYHIFATTLEGDETGEFTLKIRKND